MQPHSEQNRQKNRKPKSRKARRRQQQEQRKFLRQNSWLILLAVLALVALIGNSLSKACGVGKEVFGVLEPFNIRMICYGASSYNLCFLVPADQAEQVVQKLHQNLFE